MIQKGRAAIIEARKHLGTWYLWGGAGPKRFDCSGLVQWCWRKAGVLLSRTTYTQVNDGRMVKHRARVKPGDAVYCHRNGSVYEHVIMVENWATAIHAPHTGAKVERCNINAKIAQLGGRYEIRRFAPWKPYRVFKRRINRGDRGADVKFLRAHLGMRTKGKYGDRATKAFMRKMNADRVRVGLKAGSKVVTGEYLDRIGCKLA